MSASTGAQQPRRRPMRIPRQSKGTCKTTGKNRYTEEGAIGAALRRSARAGHALRCYQCETCGDWHLTKRVVPLKIQNQRGDKST